MGNKTFYFWYKVISLGYYLTPVKLTQKNSKDCIQYQIPDNYSIKTEVSGIKICCETKYQLNGKVKFIIQSDLYIVTPHIITSYKIPLYNHTF